MSRKLTNLLGKGKLTGEEVGQLMIKDLLSGYEYALKNPAVMRGEKETKSLLSDTERTALVDGLTTNEDIRAYNNYRALHEYLLKDSTLLALCLKDAEIGLWKLTHLLTHLKTAEEEYSYSRYKPTIMTQKQYDKLKEEEINRVLEITESVASLILHSVEYYTRLYLEGEKTPFTRYFNKAKKEALTNERLINNCGYDNGYYLTPDGTKSKNFTQEEWQEELKKYPPYNEYLHSEENPDLSKGDIILHNRKVSKKHEGKKVLKWIEDYTAPEGTTKLDMLEEATEHYDPYIYTEARDEGIFWEFREDYPELYKALLKKLSQTKGLEFIKDIPENKYFDETIIKWKDLVDNNIMNYRNHVDNPNIDGYFGIAVLQEGYILEHRITEEGEYNPPEWRERYKAENFLEENRDFLKSEYDLIVSNIRHSLAIVQAFRLIGEFIKIPEISMLVEPITIHANVEYLNILVMNIIQAIERYEKTPNERPAEELKQEIEELLPYLEVDKLEPKEEDIKKAKEMIKDFSIFKGNMDSVYHVLKGGK